MVDTSRVKLGMKADAMKLVASFLPDLKRSRGLVRQADQARDAKNYSEAARLYSEYLAINPTDAGIHIQCAHMNKEIGLFDSAGKHYEVANRLLPDDADLQVQLGHYHKVCGKLDDAIVAYRRAVELAPDSMDAHKQLTAALALAETPKREQISVGATILARARLNTDAGEFLRNVQPGRFDETVRSIAETQRFDLLDGVEQRFPDPRLSEASIVGCLELCLAAGELVSTRVIVEHVLASSPDMAVPLKLLRLVLAAPSFQPVNAGVGLPLEVQTAMLSVATNIISRQRAIIDELAPMP